MLPLKSVIFIPLSILAIGIGTISSSEADQSDKNGVTQGINGATYVGQNTPKRQQSRPRRRTSGGDRNLCKAPLVAIVPGSGDVSLDPNSCTTESIATPSQTAMRSPIVWFYIPDYGLPEVTGELVLLNQGQRIHQSRHQVTTGGLHPIQFDYNLNPNQTYDWLFSLILDADQPTNNPTVENQITFTPYTPRELSDVPQNNPLLEAQYHFQKDRVQDSLNSIAQGVCTSPSDPILNQVWQQVIQSINLTGIQSSPWKTCTAPLSQ